VCGEASGVSRLERRREQNRRAARGSRERKRQHSATVVKVSKQFVCFYLRDAVLARC